MDVPTLVRRWLFCGLMPLLLVGCGGGNKASSTPPDPASNEVRQFHEAVNDGDVEIVRRLIGAKPYLVNAKNEQGVSPLQAARQQNNDELAQLLQSKGARE
jgi:ankyrin repeat protein